MDSTLSNKQMGAKLHQLYVDECQWDDSGAITKPAASAHHASKEFHVCAKPLAASLMAILKQCYEPRIGKASH